MWRPVTSKLGLSITLTFELAILFICLKFPMKKTSPSFRDVKSLPAQGHVPVRVMEKTLNLYFNIEKAVA